MQPLGRRVFGALRVEYPAICRGDMAPREAEHVTKADLASHPMLAWDLLSEEAIDPRWTYHDPDTLALEQVLLTAVGP
jgi:hypothetical protein